MNTDDILDEEAQAEEDAKYQGVVQEQGRQLMSLEDLAKFQRKVNNKYDPGKIKALKKRRKKKVQAKKSKKVNRQRKK